MNVTYNRNKSTNHANHNLVFCRHAIFYVHPLPTQSFILWCHSSHGVIKQRFVHSFKRQTFKHLIEMAQIFTLLDEIQQKYCLTSEKKKTFTLLWHEHKQFYDFEKVCKLLEIAIFRLVPFECYALSVITFWAILLDVCVCVEVKSAWHGSQVWAMKSQRDVVSDVHQTLLLVQPNSTKNMAKNQKT